MKTIIIKLNSFGIKILEHLNEKKEHEEKMKKKVELIREIGWEKYLEKRMSEGAKFVSHDKDVQKDRELDIASVVDTED